MKRLTKQLVGALLGGSALVQCSGASGMLAYISDEVLGKMRGRYIEAANGNITYFGVQMASVWQSQNGVAQGVAVTLQGQPGLVPTMTTYKLEETGALPSGTAPATPKGLDSVQGVSQATQISGNGNRAANQSIVTITTGGGSDGTGLPAGRWQVSAGEGVSNSNNQLTLRLEQGASGKLTQAIGHGGVSQYIRLDTDRTAVQNYLNIQVGMQPGGQSPANRFANTLLMLRGLPQAH